MKISAIIKKGQKFSIIEHIKSPVNIINFILSIISIVAIWFMKEDIAKLFNMKLDDATTARTVLAFLAGYLNQSLIKNLVSMFSNKKDN